MKTGNVVWAMLVLWGFASACGAQQVIHACRAASGAVVYQDAMCANGMREVAVRTYVTPRDPPDAARRLDAIDRQVHAQWEHERWAGAGPVRRRGTIIERVSPDERDLDRRRCHAARAAVTRAARSRTFHGDRAALEEAVVDACFAL